MSAPTVSDETAAATQAPFRHGSPVPPTVESPPTLEYLLLSREIEDFLYTEADLLDHWRYRDWLELTTDDIRYWAPIRRNVRYGQWHREQSDGRKDLAWFDDSHTTLEMRVRQLESGIHWSEEPLSRVCHVVSGVRIIGATPSVAAATEVTVRSRFVVYRNHLDDEESLFLGKREDVLRKQDGWRLARRSIFIDQSVLLSQNLTILL
jgi:3-phenylpropionate/cinnamic acid dioxygenase small subunit